jgi:hypothetical protein
MAERRKLKRRHLLYYLRVYNAQTGRLIGHLVDISSGGVMVMSQHRRRLGCAIQLRMILPGPANTTRQQVEFDAVTRWCKKDINPDFWDTGYETADLTKKQVAEIENLIEDYGFRD